MLFASITYTIDRKKRAYPTNLITAMSWCFTLAHFGFVFPQLCGYTLPHGFCDDYHIQRIQHWPNVVQGSLILFGTVSTLGLLCASCLNLVWSLWFEQKFFPFFDRWYVPYSIALSIAAVCTVVPLSARVVDYTTSSAYSIIAVGNESYEYSFFWTPIIFYLSIQIFSLLSAVIILYRREGWHSIVLHQRLLLLVVVLVLCEGSPLSFRFYEQSLESDLATWFAEWVKCAAAQLPNCKLQGRTSFVFFVIVNLVVPTSGIATCAVLVLSWQTVYIWRNAFSASERFLTSTFRTTGGSSNSNSAASTTMTTATTATKQMIDASPTDENQSNFNVSMHEDDSVFFTDSERSGGATKEMVSLRATKG